MLSRFAVEVSAHEAIKGLVAYWWLWCRLVDMSDLAIDLLSFLGACRFSELAHLGHELALFVLECYILLVDFLVL